jgi:cytochrome c biogenesis protein CcmG, thiol:disulfide interchange protein DsbE
MRIAMITVFVLLSAPILHAAEIDLSVHKGKVIYLDFWASWCGPCKESFPWMNDLAKNYPDVKVIAVNLDKEKKDADAFLAKYPAQFEVLFDPSGKSAETYKVKGMPYSIIIDKNGKQIESHIGFSKEKSNEYIQQIKKLLGEK